MTIPLLGQCLVRENKTLSSYSIISDSDFFDETIKAYGGKSGQMLQFNPEELTARNELPNLAKN